MLDLRIPKTKGWYLIFVSKNFNLRNTRIADSKNLINNK